MKKNLIGSKSKQPIFFSFKRILEYQGIDFNYDSLLEEFQENFEIEQQRNWTQYWKTQGEDIILQTWNEKYKDYLQENVKENEEETQPDNLIYTVEIETESKEYQNSNQNTNLEQKIVEEKFEEKTWEDLWHEHREEIYLENYLIFSSVFYNYFLDIKKSYEASETSTEALENEDTDLDLDNSTLMEDLEKLKLLGLPTSFGGRSQSSIKKQKISTKPTYYSDFFSDSEMENESSGSEMEENSIEISTDDAKDFDDCLNSVKDNNNGLHSVQHKSISKTSKRKRDRKLKNIPPFILEEKGLLKYWRKRFSLFSRFDEGIRLDRESWFSVTPEKVAKHLADRLACNIIVDGFCGSGGNTIQFAHTCQKVIAIDIDPVKLEMAKHNAKIYKVSHKIEFILGDFLQLSSRGRLKADIVFLSPPWGGPKYKCKAIYDIEKYLLPVKASELVSVSQNVSKNIALFLPRNSNFKQIVKLAGIGNRCEIEHNYLDSRLVALTALYGEELLKKNNNLMA